jgi:hypothetical protein
MNPYADRQQNPVSVLLAPYHSRTASLAVLIVSALHNAGRLQAQLDDKGLEQTPDSGARDAAMAYWL